MKFRIDHKKADNATVYLKRIAETHNYPISYSKYGQIHLLIDGDFYAFDRVEYAFEGVEGVLQKILTVCLKKVEREPKKQYEVHRILRCVDEVLVVDGFDALKDAETFLQTLKTPAHVVKIDENGSVTEILKRNY